MEKLTLALLLIAQMTIAQDSTFLSLMSKNTYTFDVKDGMLIGEGADFLKKEFKESQYVIIGEFHDSPQISKFTAATIKAVDQYGFNTLGLEIGEHALVDIVAKLKGKSKKEVDRHLANYHNRYSYFDEDKDRITTIPFLDYKEDAAFFAEAIEKDWNVIGLDQEFMHSFVPAIDIMFRNLSAIEQNECIELKKTVQDSIRSYDQQDIDGVAGLIENVKQDKAFEKLMTCLSKNEKNKDFVRAIYESIDIYALAMIERQYYKAFNTRLLYFKKQLKKQLLQHKFDMAKDKMLLKYGGLHTEKGSGRTGCFDIGNCLHELAAFNGNKSLHLYFRSRFYQAADGEIEDAASNPKASWLDLIKLGQKDKWVAIDLRPARAHALFYPYAYNLTERYKKLITNQDILIIPSMDYDGTDNR